jgi:renalase
MKISRQIAVIGAGISGLACAGALQRAGVEVQLFEKSRRVSGRMSTRRGQGWQCDHGAQHFGVTTAAFRAEVARWEQAGVACLWTPRLHRLDGAGAGGRVAEEPCFVGTPGMTAPAAWLAGPLSVHTESLVDQLQHDARGWQVLCRPLADPTPDSPDLPDLREARFDAVLLALPAPQAAALLQPVATELATLAGGVAMHPCWTLMLRFDVPPALPFDAALVSDGALRWIACDSSKPGRDGTSTWLLHATAAWSQAHLEQDSQQVAAALLAAFYRLGGPVPEAWSAHRWRHANTEGVAPGACLWRAQDGLGLCGDWLNGGTVEGAWLSGVALARQVLGSAAAAPRDAGGDGPEG